MKKQPNSLPAPWPCWRFRRWRKTARFTSHWAPKAAPVPYIGANKPITRLDQVLAKHQGQTTGPKMCWRPNATAPNGFRWRRAKKPAPSSMAMTAPPGWCGAARSVSPSRASNLLWPARGSWCRCRCGCPTHGVRGDTACGSRLPAARRLPSYPLDSGSIRAPPSPRDASIM